MAVKTIFSEKDFEIMLSNYNLGNLLDFKPIEDGTVQTNYFINTEKGRFVLKYYEQKSREEVIFEIGLYDVLEKNGFPTAKCAHPKIDEPTIYMGKPLVIFEFIDGEHIHKPNMEQKYNLVRLIAELSNICKGLKPNNWEYRLAYTKETCLDVLNKRMEEIATDNTKEKYKWYISELEKIELPVDLTMGICHCDYFASNIFYEGNEIKALIDFDDANYCCLYFDIISATNFFGKFDHDTWQNFNLAEDILDFNEFKEYLKVYEEIHKISDFDKMYFYDILKLNIMIDCIWYFERGDASDFFEKRKIEALNKIGREGFYQEIFG